MRLLKILLVTSIFPPEIGGPATYCYQLAKDLRKKFQVSLVTFSRDDKKTIKNKPRIETIPVTVKGNIFQRQWRLFNVLWQEIDKFDLIYAQDALVVGFMSLLVAKLKTKSLIIKFVGDIVWETARNQNRFSGNLENFYYSKLLFSDKLKVLAQKLVLKLSNKIIVPSKYLQQFLINQFKISEQKIIVIHNGIFIDKKAKFKKNPNLAVTVARLVSWKGIEKILESVKKIPNLKYFIAGSGPEEKKIIVKIKKLKLGSRVKLLGVLDKKEIIKLLRQSTYFILNSSYEGLPHALLEAAGCQNTIVAPRLPGVREIFDNNQAWLFKPGELSAVLKKAVKNKLKSRKKAILAFDKISKEFIWQTTFEKTVKEFLQ